MKKAGYVILICSLLCLLCACSQKTFNGSSTGNDHQFIMEYTVLNTSDHRNLVLKSGDVIDAKIVSQSGSVDIEVQNSAGESIYKEADVPTSDFEIKISQDDTYQFSVTGHQAKGSVSFIKNNSNNEKAIKINDRF